MLGTVVDTDALLKVVAGSLAAGVGVTTVFSIVIVTATRSVELRREGEWLGAGIFAALAAVGLAACAVAVIVGIRVMAGK